MLKKTIISVVVLVLVFGLGMFAGTKLKSKSVNQAGQPDTFQAGYDAAKKRLQEQGIGTMPANVEIKSVFGTVQKISGKSVVIKVAATVIDLLSDPNLDLRTVQLTDSTKIYQSIQKDSQQFQQEMADFQKKSQEQANNKDAAAQPVVPPTSFDKKEISVADIKEGQGVTITADEDIKDKKEFTATEILIQPIVSAPPIQSSSEFANPAPLPAVAVPTNVPTFPNNIK